MMSLFSAGIIFFFCVCCFFFRKKDGLVGRLYHEVLSFIYYLISQYFCISFFLHWNQIFVSKPWLKFILVMSIVKVGWNVEYQILYNSLLYFYFSNIPHAVQSADNPCMYAWCACTQIHTHTHTYSCSLNLFFYK